MISIVVPNFNSGQRLAKNLPKLLELLKKTKLDFEVIVTDDASSDDSLGVLRNLSHLSNLKFVTFPKNTGFGTNVDRGIRASKGEIVFILNAIDILPAKQDYFSLMLKHFGDSGVFSVAAAKKDEIGTHGCGEIYFSRGFYLHRHKPVTSGQVLVTSDWADGGAQAIRREYYLKIGGFDPIYKLYWEDVDLGYRAWQAGYKIIYEPKAILLHDKSEGPIAKRYSDKELRRMNLYGQFIFTWKNADLIHLLQYFLWEPYHAAVALKNRDWVWFVAYWQAVFQWLEIIKRRVSQKVSKRYQG